MDVIAKYVLPFVVLVFAAACRPDDIGTVYVENDDSGDAVKSVELFIDTSYGTGTKTMLGSGIEELFTGAVLAVYDADTGLLDTEIDIPSETLGSSMLIRLPQNRIYDMYLVGNLWNVEKDSGELTALSFPAHSDEVKEMTYILDGSEVDAELRRESFEDVARCGIPLCWSRQGVDAAAVGRIDISMERLFAKLVLTIDNRGLNGTVLEEFINGSVALRQSNAKLLPFADDGSKAETPEEVLEVGDYDSVMENGLIKDYVFYVPENRHGILMPDNDDPSLKDIDGVEEACGNSGISNLLTYVEFTGSLSGENSGISGDLTYRFFLGYDATSDFTVDRNHEYRVYLSFNPNSIFNPDWRVDNDGLTDTRDFYISGDLAGRLPDGKMVVVRKNRPGTFRLNLNTGGSAENRILEAKLVDSGYEIESLEEIAWTSDFYNASSASGDYDAAPYARVLSNSGIVVSYDDGCFTFSVEYPELFQEGESWPLKIRLYPGDKEINFVLATYPDQEVIETQGRSLSEDFYLAQSRELRFNGFVGEKIYYVAEQESSGLGLDVQAVNRQWKTDNSESGTFPTVYYDAGEVIYPYMDYSLYEGQCLDADAALGVYAFYPNYSDIKSFQTFVSGSGTISFCSEDVHNDGVVSLPVIIALPHYVTDNTSASTTLTEAILPFDGKGFEPACHFEDLNGNRMTKKDFDEELYDMLLKQEVNFSLSDDASLSIWGNCIVWDDDLYAFYLGKTSVGNVTLENSFPGEWLTSEVARVTIVPNSKVRSLYASNAVNYTKWYSFKLSIPRFDTTYGRSQNLLYFTNTGMDSEIEVGVLVRYPDGDSSALVFDETGPVMQYKCRNSNEIFTPVTRLEYESDVLWYRYFESEQTRLSAAREVVPGGLIVPYGDHSFHLEVTNRWDGRTITDVKEFTISYTAILGQILVAELGKRYGTVFLVAPKNAEYYIEDGVKIPGSAVADYLRILGSYEWANHLCIRNAYYYYGWQRAGEKFYHGPVADCDAKYFGTQSAWTVQLLERVFSYDQLLMYDGVNFYDTSNYELLGSTSDDAELTGSEYLQISLSTSILGYVYMVSEYDYP